MRCDQIKPGMLRHRVAFEREQRTSDGGGGTSTEWIIAAGPLQGMLKPVSGNERYFANRLEANITHQLWVRYRTGLEESMRVVYYQSDGTERRMQVRSILNMEERNSWLQIGLEEGVFT